MDQFTDGQATILSTVVLGGKEETSDYEESDVIDITLDDIDNEAEHNYPSTSREPHNFKNLFFELPTKDVCSTKRKQEWPTEQCKEKRLKAEQEPNRNIELDEDEDVVFNYMTGTYESVKKSAKLGLGNIKIDVKDERDNISIEERYFVKKEAGAAEAGTLRRPSVDIDSLKPNSPKEKAHLQTHVPQNIISPNKPDEIVVLDASNLLSRTPYTQSTTTLVDSYSPADQESYQSINSPISSLPLYESSDDTIVIPENNLNSENVSSNLVKSNRFILKDLIVLLKPLPKSSLISLNTSFVDSSRALKKNNGNSDKSRSKVTEFKHINKEEQDFVKKLRGKLVSLINCVCKTCNYRAKTKNCLISHIYNNHLQKEYEMKITCNSCRFECGKSRDMEQHKLTHAVSIPEKCSTLPVISSVKSIASSTENNNDPECTNNTPTKNFACNSGKAPKTTVAKNIKNVSNDKKNCEDTLETLDSEEDVDSETSTKRYKCFFCKFRTRKELNLKYHAGIHNGKKYFCDHHFWSGAEISCPKCIFENIMSNLSRSLLTCKKCGYSTTRGSYFKIHAAAPFSCSQYLVRINNKKKRLEGSVDQNKDSEKNVEFSQKSSLPVESIPDNEIPSVAGNNISFVVEDTNISSMNSDEPVDSSGQENGEKDMTEKVTLTDSAHVSPLNSCFTQTENALSKQVNVGKSDENNEQSDLQISADLSKDITNEIPLNPGHDQENSVSVSIETSKDPGKAFEEENSENPIQDEKNNISSSEVMETDGSENRVQNSADFAVNVSSLNLSENGLSKQASVENFDKNNEKPKEDANCLNPTQNKQTAKTGSPGEENEVHSSAYLTKTAKNSVPTDNNDDKIDCPKENDTSIPFKCFDCDSPVSKKDELKSHALSCHPDSSFKCDIHTSKINFHECGKCLYELIFKTRTRAVALIDDPFDVDMSWTFNSEIRASTNGKNTDKKYEQRQSVKRSYYDVDSDSEFDCEINPTKVRITRSETGKNKDVAADDSDCSKSVTKLRQVRAVKETKISKCDCSYSKIYNDFESFKNHVSRHMGSKFQCTEHKDKHRKDCMKCVYELVLKHLKSVVQSCKNCGYTTSNILNFERHVRKEACERWKKSPKLLVGEMLCFVCQYRTMHKNQMTYHMVDHLDVEFSCKEHVIMKNDCLKCVYAECLTNAKKEVVVCEKCQFKTANTEVFEVHSCRKHPADDDQERHDNDSAYTLKESSKLLKSFKCFDCDGFTSPPTCLIQKIHRRSCEYQKDVISSSETNNNGSPQATCSKNFVNVLVTNNNPLSDKSAASVQVSNENESNTETPVPALKETHKISENIASQFDNQKTIEVISKILASKKQLSNNEAVEVVKHLLDNEEKTENFEPVLDNQKDNKVSNENHEKEMEGSITETILPSLKITEVLEPSLDNQKDDIVSNESHYNGIEGTTTEMIVPSLEIAATNAENVQAQKDNEKNAQISQERNENKLDFSNIETLVNAENVKPQINCSQLEQVSPTSNEIEVSNTETIIHSSLETTLNPESIDEHSKGNKESLRSVRKINNTAQETRRKCFDCDFFGENFPFVKHLYRHIGSKFQCLDHLTNSSDICAKCYYVKTLRSIYGEMISCKTCGYRTMYKSDLAIHLARKQPCQSWTDRKLTLKEFICFKCQYITTHMDFLKYHMVDHLDQQYSCEIHSGSKNETCLHCINEDCLDSAKKEVVTCKKCSFKTVNKQVFDKHNCQQIMGVSSEDSSEEGSKEVLDVKGENKNVSDSEINQISDNEYTQSKKGGSNDQDGDWSTSSMQDEVEMPRLESNCQSIENSEIYNENNSSNLKMPNIDTNNAVYCLDCKFFSLDKGFPFTEHICRHIGSKFQCIQHPNKLRDCHKCVYENALKSASKICKSCKCGYKTADKSKLARHMKHKLCRRWTNRPMINGEIQCLLCRYVTIHKKFLMYHMVDHLGQALTCNKKHDKEDRTCQRCLNEECLESARKAVIICVECNFKSVIKHVFDTHDCNQILGKSTKEYTLETDTSVSIENGSDPNLKTSSKSSNNQNVSDSSTKKDTDAKSQIEVRCFDCKYSSPENDINFKKHVCSHVGSKYQCIEHWKSKVDNCSKCVYEVSLQNLQKEVIICNNCGYKALDELTMTRHKKRLDFCNNWTNRNLEPGVIRCLQCQYVTMHRKFLKYHMVDHLNLTYSCDEHKENKDEKCNKCIYEICLQEAKKEVKTCDKCNFKTVIKHVFKLHECNVMLKTTSVENIVRKSETSKGPSKKDKSNNSKFQCFDCRFSCKIKSYGRMNHISRHIGSKFQCLKHNDVKREKCKKCTYETMLKTASDTAKSCESCTFRTADSYSLFRHRNSKDSCKMWSNRVPAQGEFHCLKCQYVTSHRKFLKYHMVDHLDETLLACDMHPNTDCEECHTCINVECLEGAKKDVKICEICMFKTAIKQVFDLHTCKGKKAATKQSDSAEAFKTTEDDRGQEKVKITKETTKEPVKEDRESLNIIYKIAAKCYDCKSFTSDNDIAFKKHICSHVGSKYQCIEHWKDKVANCPKCHYEKLLQNLQKNVKTCNICNFKALDDVGLTRHLKEFGSCSNWANRNLLPDEVRCLQCQYTTVFKKFLKYHMVDHLDLTFSCEVHTDKIGTCEKCIFEVCLEGAKKEVKICETCEFTTAIKQIFDIHECKQVTMVNPRENGQGASTSQEADAGTSKIPAVIVTSSNDISSEKETYKVRCFDCRFVCADKYVTFRKHVCRHIGSKFLCMEHENFKSTECPKCYYEVVLTSFDTDLLTCSTCGFKTIDSTRMTRHKDNKQACKRWIERKPPPGELKCFECQYITTHKRFLKYHMVDHLDVEFACKNDHKTKDDNCLECIYEDCLKSAKKEALVCEKCNFKTVIGKVFKIHKCATSDVVIKKEASNEKPVSPSKAYTVECQVCHFKTRMNEEFNKHNCDQHGKNIPDQSYTNEISTTHLFNCYHCEFKSNDSSGLKNHAIRHYGQPFRCDDHNGIRGYNCQKCHYEELLQKYKTLLKICGKCDYKTLDDFQFDNHVKRNDCSRIDGSNIKHILKCFDCGATYHSEHGLKGHAVQHSDSKFKCDEHLDSINYDCLKCIYQDVVKNIETSTYICSNCGYRAYSWNNLKNHEKSKVNCQLYKAKLLAEGRSLAVSQIKSYQCFDCDFTHERKDFLITHIHVHENSSFQCDTHHEHCEECPKCLYREMLNKIPRKSMCFDCEPNGLYTTKYNLKRHIFQAHKDSFYVCMKHTYKWENCAACNYELLVKQTFRRVYQLVCHDCGEQPVFDKKEKLKDHIKGFHLRSGFVCNVHLLERQPDTCNQCLYEDLILQCENEVTFSENVVVASTSKGAPQLYECFNCDYKTSIDTALSYHINRKHLESDFSCTVHTLGDIDVTSCAMCRYECALLQCKQNFLIKCSKCNFETLKQDDLDKHYKQKHSKESFMDTAIVSEDFRKKRPNMLQCFDCKSYITNSHDNLFRHLCSASHASYRTSEYTCDNHRMYDNTCDKCIFARLRKNARDGYKKRKPETSVS